MRSGSRSQAESQCDVQDSATRDNARPLDALRSRTPRCQIARQLKKESNMPSGRLMKHLFLPLLVFGVIAAATAALAQPPRQPLFLLSATIPTSLLSKTI